MSDTEKKPLASEDEEKDETVIAEEQESEEDADAEKTDADEEDEGSEDEETVEHTDKEIDYDAEIEAENKRGKPDPEKARDAFKNRKEKKGDQDEEEDKPLTRRDVADLLSNDRKERRESEAFEIANRLAGSAKEAQLIVAKWKNRSFPETLPLTQQIEEAYAITHSKRLIGERNEAVRALGNKDKVNKNAASTHRDGPTATAPKLAPQDAAAIKAAGFVFNNKSRQYEKTLKNGSILVRDPKTKQVRLVKKA